MCDTNLHYKDYKDCSEMHSGNCSQMTLSWKCPIAVYQSHFKTCHFNTYIPTPASSKRVGRGLSLRPRSLRSGTDYRQK